MNPPPTKLTKHETESMWVVILSNNLEEGEREPQRERGGRRRGGGGHTRKKEGDWGETEKDTESAREGERERDVHTNKHKVLHVSGHYDWECFLRQGRGVPPPLPL